MKINQNLLTLSLLFPAFLFLSSCQKEEDETAQLSVFYHSASSEVEIPATTRYAVATNSAGAITVSTKVNDGLLNAFLYKTIWAESQNDANLHFKDITFISSILSDSVKFIVNAPTNSNSIRYVGNLSMELPGNLIPIFRSPNKGVKTTSLSSNVFVYGSEGSIELIKHNGSVDLKTSNGNITAGFTFFKNGGFCRCYSENGNITIEIPKSISATLSAKTENGFVSYSNLTITDKVESSGILTGTLAIGSGEIHLETKKGNITIKGI